MKAQRHRAEETSHHGARRSTLSPPARSRRPTRLAATEASGRLVRSRPSASSPTPPRSSIGSPRLRAFQSSIADHSPIRRRPGSLPVRRSPMTRHRPWVGCVLAAVRARRRRQLEPVAAGPASIWWRSPRFYEAASRYRPRAAACARRCMDATPGFSQLSRDPSARHIAWVDRATAFSRDRRAAKISAHVHASPARRR